MDSPSQVSDSQPVFTTTSLDTTFRGMVLHQAHIVLTDITSSAAITYQYVGSSQGQRVIIYTEPIQVIEQPSGEPTARLHWIPVTDGGKQRLRWSNSDDRYTRTNNIGYFIVHAENLTATTGAQLEIAPADPAAGATEREENEI